MDYEIFLLLLELLKVIPTVVLEQTSLNFTQRYIKECHKNKTSNVCVCILFVFKRV